MSAIVTNLIALFLLAGLGFGLWDLRRPKSRMRGIVLCCATVITAGALALLTGFPRPSATSFGSSPLLIFAAMLVAVIAGAMASYFFEFKSTFSWLELLRPTVTAPIILLPLLGSIDASGDVSQLQFIFLVVVAFQNGFFWKIVLEKAGVGLRAPVPSPERSQK